MRKIDNTMIDDDTLEDLWEKSDTYGVMRPNIDLTCKLGQDLNVDLVFLYAYYWDNEAHGWDIDIYLVDVLDRSSYQKTGKYSFSNIHYGTKTFIERFFTAYTKDNLQ